MAWRDGQFIRASGGAHQTAALEGVPGQEARPVTDAEGLTMAAILPVTPPACKVREKGAGRVRSQVA